MISSKYSENTDKYVFEWFHSIYLNNIIYFLKFS